MRAFASIALTALVTASLVYFLREPEIETVEIEKIRTIVAPTALKLPTLKLSDEKLGTQVKINRDTMKRMTIGTWHTNGFGKDILEFLKMTPEETEQCTAVVKKTVSRLKEFESKHVRVKRDADGSETLVVDSYWESGGQEQFAGMQNQFVSILGKDRGDILAMGIGQSSFEIGNFGYFQTHLFIQDELQPDGTAVPMVHIFHEAPFSGGLRKMMEQEQDPVKKQQMADSYAIMKNRYVSANDDHPIANFGSVMPVTDKFIAERYIHVFKTQEGREKSN